MIQNATLETGPDAQASITPTADGLPAITINVGSAADNIDVTGFCLTATATRPSAKSACFSDTKQWTVPIGPAWRVWARDAAGNVSDPLAAPGPCSADAQAAAQSSLLPTVCLKTDAGDIVLELAQDKAPETVKNFVAYVQDGFYANTVFHRIVSNFVVQGGGFAVSGNGSRFQKTDQEGLRDPIALEKTSATGLSNLTGTVAMARTDVLDSATSQFFINVVDNKSLDADGSAAPGNGYAVFGKVIFGLETTVQRLRSAPVSVNSSGENSSPLNNIFIQWAYLLP